jgi:hypothetical protein
MNYHDMDVEVRHIKDSRQQEADAYRLQSLARKARNSQPRLAQSRGLAPRLAALLARLHVSAPRGATAAVARQPRWARG